VLKAYQLWPSFWIRHLFEETGVGHGSDSISANDAAVGLSAGSGRSLGWPTNSISHLAISTAVRPSVVFGRLSRLPG